MELVKREIFTTAGKDYVLIAFVDTTDQYHVEAYEIAAKLPPTSSKSLEELIRSIKQQLEALTVTSQIK